MSQPYQSRRDPTECAPYHCYRPRSIKVEISRSSSASHLPIVCTTHVPRATKLGDSESGQIRLLQLRRALPIGIFRDPQQRFVKKDHCAGIFCAFAPEMTRKGLVFAVSCWRACRFFSVISCGYVFGSPRCLAGVCPRRQGLGFTSHTRILCRWNAFRRFARFLQWRVYVQWSGGVRSIKKSY
jgi:hypothetical protein